MDDAWSLQISVNSNETYSVTSKLGICDRGVVVPERGGAPFRQIFLSRNGAPANIVYHRRNADTAAFRQISSGRGPVY